MLNIWEIEDHSFTWWEVWKDYPGMPWQDEYICTLEDQNELDLYLDICRLDGVDFVIHELGGIDEYHVALS